MKSTFLITLAAVAAGGCLDLDLLDEMELLDAGGDESGGDDGIVDESGGDDGSGGDDPGGGSGEGGEGPPSTDADDVESPALVAFGCGGAEHLVGETCVAEGPASASIRFGTDESATVSIVAVEGMGAGVVSEPWAMEHHLVVVGSGAEDELSVTVEMEDVNGNPGSFELQIALPGGPAIAITEVLADPVGPEPAQEFVEVANFGAVAMDISGWMIDDGGDANGDLIPPGTVLEPGQVGLIVSSSYDPAEGQDPAPSPTARLIQLESSVGSNGLKNSEAESVELYDGTGALISAYDGRLGTPVEGTGVVRLLAELPDGDPLAFDLDEGKGCTPGSTATLP